MAISQSALIARIDELLVKVSHAAGASNEGMTATSEAFQGALNLVNLVYGPNAPQEKTLVDAIKAARSKPTAMHYNFHIHVAPAVMGTLEAMKGDVNAGLIGNVRRQAVGEVLADMLALAKEALSQGSAGATNVAAVLTAASFEDTIREMGATLAGVQGRPDLADVVTALKSAGVLTGAPLTTALSYLKFRNDALHADWAKLNAAVVGSCIAFVEGLILQYLS